MLHFLSLSSQHKTILQSTFIKLVFILALTYSLPLILLEITNYLFDVNSSVAFFLYEILRTFGCSSYDHWISIWFFHGLALSFLSILFVMNSIRIGALKRVDMRNKAYSIQYHWYLNHYKYFVALKSGEDAVFHVVYNHPMFVEIYETPETEMDIFGVDDEYDLYLPQPTPLEEALRALWESIFISTSHKIIGFSYLFLGLLMGLVAFVLSQLMRFELGYHGLIITRYSRMILEYNAIISTHGIVMLFGFVMPVGFAALGNWFLPIELGVAELAMPRLNMASLWLIALGIMTYASGALVQIGGLNSGWTFYPPLSTRDTDAMSIATDLMLLSVHALGLSSAIGSINFICTMKNHRHRCQELLGATLYAWSLLITAVLLVLALPLLALAVTGVILDRSVITVIFDGQLQGDPVMFQHLFWFFGHPEVYIVMLPVFGLVSITIAMVCQSTVIGKDSMVFCMWAIAIVGFVVWGHHMFVVGMDVDSRVYFSVATAIIAVPTAVKVFSYAATIISARPLGGSSLLWSIWSFLASFIAGGISGLLLSSAGLDIFYHDTYFVVGHFHTVLSLGTVFGLILAFDAIRALLTGFGLMEVLNTTFVLLLLSGAILVFGPMHTSGMSGMTRRVPEAPDVYLSTMQVGTTGAFLLICSVVLWIRLMYITLAPTVMTWYNHTRPIVTSKKITTSSCLVSLEFHVQPHSHPPNTSTFHSESCLSTLFCTYTKSKHPPQLVRFIQFLPTILPFNLLSLPQFDLLLPSSNLTSTIFLR